MIPSHLPPNPVQLRPKTAPSRSWSFLQTLDGFNKIESHRERVKAVALNAFESTREELGESQAERHLNTFLKPFQDWPLPRVEKRLEDYTALRLWEEPQSQIYQMMTDQEYYGDYPRRFTEMVLEEVPGVTQSQRTSTFRRFLSRQNKETFRYQETKVHAYEAIVTLHQRGWSWDEANRSVMSLATALPKGEKAYWFGTFAMRDFLSARLDEPQRRLVYLRCAEMGYQRDWPAQLIDLLEKPVGETDLHQRLNTLARLTKAAKPWFEQPEEVLEAYQGWACRVQAGSPPEASLKVFERLTERFKKDEFRLVFGALERLGPLSGQEGEWTPTKLLESRFEDREVFSRLLTTLQGEDPLEVSDRFYQALEAGHSPEQAARLCLTGSLLEGQTETPLRLEEEGDLLIIGDEQVPIRLMMKRFNITKPRNEL